jgi:hypothetical protein
MADDSTSTDKPSTAGAVPTPQPKPQLTGFLKDARGKPSSMRLMCFVALFASIWFGWITLHSNTAGQNGVFITTGFLLAAFAPKALQRFIEDYAPKE